MATQKTTAKASLRLEDGWFILLLAVIFIPFFVSSSLYDYYAYLNDRHGLAMSFLKFALLATMGESLGLRIRQGVYSYDGFGLFPRAVVWGFLGIGIKIAFVIFNNGSASFLGYMAVENSGTFSSRLLYAFTASSFLNLIFAPVMMVAHKVSDTHILQTGGTVRGLLSRISVSEILQHVDWKVMWGFVLKRTIPFFWIPAHTITFMLPASFQVLFAAILGVALGVILALAANKRP